MKKLFFIISIVSFSVNAIAQKPDLVKVADSIRAEAEILYRSEFASWYGTDAFKAKCADKLPKAGGYLSYDNGKNLINVFYSNTPNPTVLATTTFGYDFNGNNYQLDTTARQFNATESALYALRIAAITEMGKDTLIKGYRNTTLNAIPIISGGRKMVYILTGTSQQNVVLFGNDYLFVFDNNNNAALKKRLHKNLIPIQMKDAPDKISIGGIHNHLAETGEFITATDICTLMLYEKFTTWKQHIVLSQNYTSIWDCERNKLSIVTAEEWKKTNVLQNVLRNNPN